MTIGNYAQRMYSAVFNKGRVHFSQDTLYISYPDGEPYAKICLHHNRVQPFMVSSDYEYPWQLDVFMDRMKRDVKISKLELILIMQTHHTGRALFSTLLKNASTPLPKETQTYRP